MSTTRPRPARARAQRRPHPAIARRRRAVRGLPTRGQVLTGLGVGAACALAGYWLATGPVFAVHGVHISGYDRADAAQLRSAVAAAADRGGSLLSPPIGAIRAQAVVYPWVQDVRVARDWPVGLAVQIIPAQPVAVGVPARGRRVLVSARGLVMGAAGARGGLPHITLPGTAPAVGATIPSAALPALRFVRFSDPVTAARFRRLHMDHGSLVGVLTAGPELRLGAPVRLRAKALALQALVNYVSAQDERAAAYFDLTVPDRPAIGSQAAVVAAQEAAAARAAAAKTPSGGKAAAPAAAQAAATGTQIPQAAATPAAPPATAPSPSTSPSTGQ